MAQRCLIEYSWCVSLKAPQLLPNPHYILPPTRQCDISCCWLALEISWDTGYGCTRASCMATRTTLHTPASQVTKLESRAEGLNCVSQTRAVNCNFRTGEPGLSPGVTQHPMILGTSLIFPVFNKYMNPNLCNATSGHLKHYDAFRPSLRDIIMQKSYPLASELQTLSPMWCPTAEAPHNFFF